MVLQMLEVVRSGGKPISGSAAGGHQKYARVKAWRLDECRQVVNRMSIVPLPTEDDLLVGLHIPQCEHTERYAGFLVFIWGFPPVLQLVASRRPESGVGPASAPRESCFAARDLRVKCEIKGRPDQMNERPWAFLGERTRLRGRRDRWKRGVWWRVRCYHG